MQWILQDFEDTRKLASVLDQCRVSHAGIIEIARGILALDPTEIPEGSFRHDTTPMLTAPTRILQEWRFWVAAGEIVTDSLYKSGARVVYRHEIDEDALAFAKTMAALNPNDASAYVIDIRRTDGGLRLLETNLINAAGFYAADLGKLVRAVEALGSAARSN